MWASLTAEPNTFYSSLADAGEPAPADSFLECAERCYTSSECQTYAFCPNSESAGCDGRRLHCCQWCALDAQDLHEWRQALLLGSHTC